MNDFRLEVFVSVAKNLSFTKASNELHISQPAVSKHISELEDIYGIQLFERLRNQVFLTKEGEIFLTYAEKIREKYRLLAFEMNLLAQRSTGKLTIGASTTIAQYVLPEMMSKFRVEYPEIEQFLITGNSEQIEELVLNHKIDVGMVEGVTHRKEFKYTRLKEDELVLVAASNLKTPDEVSIMNLSDLPLVMREEGSGTLAVIQKFLQGHGVKMSKLNVVMRLGSTEAIKRFVMAGDCYAIVSISAVINELKRSELSIIDLKEGTIKRDFSFITNNGSHDGMVEQFIHFVLSAYNKKL